MMPRAQLDGTMPIYDPQRYPKMNSVADPRVSPPRVPGVHYWVRLIDEDLYLSCMWCGQLHPNTEDTGVCPGRARLDILHAPIVFESTTDTAMSSVTPPIDEATEDIEAPF